MKHTSISLCRLVDQTQFVTQIPANISRQTVVDPRSSAGFTQNDVDCADDIAGRLPCDVNRNNFPLEILMLYDKVAFLAAHRYLVCLLVTF